ncbi:MAG: hypothetical protein AAGE01_15615 [Pseudomonadota bacterium]
MGLFAELRRRNVFKVAVFYLVSSWLVLQVADLLFDLLGFPDTWLRLVAVLLALGLPLVLAFSWIFELTPDGLKRETSIDRSQPRDDAIGRRLNVATIVVVLLGMGALLADRMRFDSVSAPPSNVSVGAEDEPDAEADEGTTPIIAVLPFAASGSDDGGFLAGGLHDDLLTRLAKLDSFRVISRTSMMEYANTTKNMREIGAELGAGYVLEGGVQARGERIRVNAQLIDATNDQHLWADTYDRQLTAADLFDIQAELAKAIADELKLTLTAPDQALIKQVPTENIEAYSAYLRGLNIRDTGHNRSTLPDAIDAFEQAVSLDPAFALGWVQLSIERSRYSQITNSDETREAALAARNRAAALDPQLPELQLADAVYLYRAQYEYARSLAALEALRRNTPLNAQQLMLKAFILRRQGRADEAYDTALRAQILDPRSLSIATNLVSMARDIDDCAAAGRHVRAAFALYPEAPDVRVHASGYVMDCEGDGARAGELLRGVERTGQFHLGSAVDAAQMAGDFERLLELSEIDDLPIFTASNFILRANAQLALGRAAAGMASLDEAESVLAAANASSAEGAEDPEVAMGYLHFYALRGDALQTQAWVEIHRRRFRELLKGNMPFEQFNRFVYAENLVAVGLHDAALDELRQMLDLPGGRSFLFIDSHRGFAPLKEHPGYEELRERYGES